MLTCESPEPSDDLFRAQRPQSRAPDLFRAQSPKPSARFIQSQEPKAWSRIIRTPARQLGPSEQPYRPGKWLPPGRLRWRLSSPAESIHLSRSLAVTEVGAEFPTSRAG